MYEVSVVIPSPNILPIIQIGLHVKWSRLVPVADYSGVDGALDDISIIGVHCRKSNPLACSCLTHRAQ